jgi:hypothetical protein
MTIYASDPPEKGEAAVKQESLVITYCTVCGFIRNTATNALDLVTIPPKVS